MILQHLCDTSSIRSHLEKNTHVGLAAPHLRCLVLIAPTRLDLPTVTFLVNKVGWWIDGKVFKPQQPVAKEVISVCTHTTPSPIHLPSSSLFFYFYVLQVLL